MVERKKNNGGGGAAAALLIAGGAFLAYKAYKAVTGPGKGEEQSQEKPKLDNQN